MIVINFNEEMDKKLIAKSSNYQCPFQNFELLVLMTSFNIRTNYTIH